MGDKIDDLYQILSKITRPAAAIKSLSFALFIFRPDQNDYSFANKICKHFLHENFQFH